MPGNRPNSTSGQAHAAAFFGHDGVARQREFHAAAERIALHERDGADVAAQAAVDVVHAVDAATRVGEQVFAVVFADQAGEQFEVATKVERGGVRGDHDMAQLAGTALVLVERDAAEVTPHLVHQFRAEARTDAGAGVGMHVQPMRGAGGLGFDAQGRDSEGCAAASRCCS